MDVREKLESTLQGLKPVLDAAGRTITVRSLDGKVCVVELGGFCGGCACSSTYKEGIEELVQGVAPDMKVEFVEVDA